MTPAFSQLSVFLVPPPRFLPSFPLPEKIVQVTLSFSHKPSLWLNQYSSSVSESHIFYHSIAVSASKTVLTANKLATIVYLSPFNFNFAPTFPTGSFTSLTKPFIEIYTTTERHPTTVSFLLLLWKILQVYSYKYNHKKTFWVYICNFLHFMLGDESLNLKQ